MEVPAHHGRGKVDAQFPSNTLDTLDYREFSTLLMRLNKCSVLPWLHQLTFYVARSRWEHGWLKQLHVAVLIARNLAL